MKDVRVEWIDDDPMDAATVSTIHRLIEDGTIGPGTTRLTRPKLAELLRCQHGPPSRRPCANCLGAD
jgi:hypothetical protein